MWLDVLAAGFGIGAGLTLDEFALWVHLEDVYWSEQGRSSLDAVVIALLVGGLVVLGLAPFELADQSGAITSIAIVVALDLCLCMLAILKGKPILGLTGLFIPFASLVGSIRLASPTSPWARRRYPPDGHKLARSQARFARIARRRRVLDAIGGQLPPSPQVEPRRGLSARLRSHHAAQALALAFAASIYPPAVAAVIALGRGAEVRSRVFAFVLAVLASSPTRSAR